MKDGNVELITGTRRTNHVSHVSEEDETVPRIHLLQLHYLERTIGDTQTDEEKSIRT